jgi:cytochrome P450
MVDMVGVREYSILTSRRTGRSHSSAEYNPRYFEEPNKYKPSRWYGLPADSELFTAFSIGEHQSQPAHCITSEAFPKGPRACIGRKFATVEATCFLALLLRDWKVLPILRDGESKEEWAARVMGETRILFTLGVGDIPIRFVRRNLA